MSEDKTNSLKRLYKDIVNGFSVFDYAERPIFIKHFSEVENGEIFGNRNKIIQDAQKLGLELEEDKLIFLIKEGEWSRDKEDQIDKLKKEKSDIELTSKSYIIKRQKDEAQKRIKAIEKSLFELQKEKDSILGLTAEDYCDKRLNEILIFNSFYREAGLSVPFFSQFEFDSLLESELLDLIRILNSFYADFHPDQIKRICACSFFINIFSICEGNPLTFFGKSVSKLTTLQTNLFSQARYFKSLMDSQQSSPPSDVIEDPDKMISWYDSIVSESSRDKKGEEFSGIGHTGATRSELERMAGGRATTIGELAAKQGNKLTKEDLMKAHGL